MPTPRNGLAVVAYDGLVYAIGGVDSDGATGSVEVYDPQSDAWDVREPKPQPVGFISAAVLEDEGAGMAAIYVPGGTGEGQRPLNVLEVYDPAQDSWESRAPLPDALSAYALASFDGSLYLFGGLAEGGYSDSVYRYHPETDRWESRTPMERALAFLGAAVVDDTVYVVGGFDGETESDACHAYDPASDTWTVCASMAQRRGGLALVTVRGMVYAVGGGLDSYLAFNERYDPRNDTWSRLENPVMGQWRGLGLAYVKPDIYAIGGWSEGNLSLNESYQALFVIVVP
jgi:N-acetylneuraminic acid mutarotase